MKIGYARVSTEDQKLDLQIQALKRDGCSRIFTDHAVSGACFDRPGLDRALAATKAGDTLVVWRLDRLGRSLIHLVQLMDKLGGRDIHFRSLSESIDTSSSGGRLVFHMMAALSEFERSLISERTRAGMAAAKSCGRQIGRPPLLSDEELSRAIHATTEQGGLIQDVAKDYGLTPRALRRMIQSRSGRLTAGVNDASAAHALHS